MNAINESGSFELTKEEIAFYAREQQITSGEYNTRLMDSWRETMGLDAPIPDDLEGQHLNLKHMSERITHDMGRPTTKHDLLMAARYQLPFVSIMPTPHTNIGLICTGSAADVVSIPDGTLLVEFKGSTAAGFNYIVDMSGNPIDFATSSTAGQQFSSTGIVNPFGRIYYVAGVRSIQVYGPAQAWFGVSCWKEII